MLPVASLSQTLKCYFPISILHPENIVEKPYSYSLDVPEVIEFCSALAMRFPHSLSGMNGFRCNLCSFHSSRHSPSLSSNFSIKSPCSNTWGSGFSHSRLSSLLGFLSHFPAFFSLNWMHLNLLCVNLLSKIKHLKTIQSSFSTGEWFIYFS